jgi:hypothetical protein
MNSCKEKERLLVAHDKGFELYIRGVSELAQAVGLMAHAEFEFLSRKVQAAMQSFDRDPSSADGAHLSARVLNAL